MLGFFKKKLKEAFESVKKQEEEIKKEAVNVVQEESILVSEKEEAPEKTEDIYEKEDREAMEENDEIEDEEEAFVEGYEGKEPEKKGLFRRVTERITTRRINEKQFDKLFWNLEAALLESNVAMEVIEKIKEDLSVDVVNVSLKGRLEEVIRDSLKSSLSDLLSFKVPNILELINEKGSKPYVILFVGVNGSGKTTTIAKVGKYLQDHGKKCVLVAGDTFRSAAIEQLEHHGMELKIPVIKQGYGADPAAVAFDGVKHAEAKKLDVVLIDTAGRQQSNTNLMSELKKVGKVSKPDLTLFVGESIAGSDCITQVKKFKEAVEIDGIILSKADVDEKGGAALSIHYVSRKPILFLGMGQRYKDLEVFDKEKILGNLGL